jgi:hypothetical protein
MIGQGRSHNGVDTVFRTQNEPNLTHGGARPFALKKLSETPSSALNTASRGTGPPGSENYFSAPAGEKTPAMGHYLISRRFMA